MHSPPWFFSPYRCTCATCYGPFVAKVYVLLLFLRIIYLVLCRVIACTVVLVNRLISFHYCGVLGPKTVFCIWTFWACSDFRILWKRLKATCLVPCHLGAELILSMIALVFHRFIFSISFHYSTLGFLNLESHFHAGSLCWCACVMRLISLLASDSCMHDQWRKQASGTLHCSSGSTSIELMYQGNQIDDTHRILLGWARLLLFSPDWAPWAGPGRPAPERRQGGAWLREYSLQFHVVLHNDTVSKA